MNKQENVPALRFPEFTGNWVVKKLGDVVQYVKGFAFQSNYYGSCGCRIIRVSDLGTDSIKYDTPQIFIDDKYLIGLQKYFIQKFDIIITTVGSKPELLDSAVGRGILVTKNGEGYLNQNLLKINVQASYENRFLFGYINTEKYITHIKEIQRGNANQSNITVKDLFEYQISFPTLPEQQKIATFLSSVDEKLQGLKKKKSLLEAYKKGMMQRLFSSESGLTRLDDEQDLDDNNPTILTSRKLRFRQDNGEDFPDWEEKTLGEVCEINPTKAKMPEEFVYIDLESVTNGRLIQKTVLQKENAPSRAQRVLQVGDILFQMVRPYQKNNLLFNEEGDYVASTGYSQIRTSQDRNYTFYYLANQSFVDKVIERCTGTSYPAINSTDLASIAVNMPSLKEQAKIGSFLSAIDEKIAKVSQEIEQVTVWKKGLLQQMFV